MQMQIKMLVNQALIKHQARVIVVIFHFQQHTFLQDYDKVSSCVETSLRLIAFLQYPRGFAKN